MTSAVAAGPLDDEKWPEEKYRQSRQDRHEEPTTTTPPPTCVRSTKMTINLISAFNGETAKVRRRRKEQQGTIGALRGTFWRQLVDDLGEVVR